MTATTTRITPTHYEARALAVRIDRLLGTGAEVGQDYARQGAARADVRELEVSLLAAVLADLAEAGALAAICGPPGVTVILGPAAPIPGESPRPLRQGSDDSGGAQAPPRTSSRLRDPSSSLLVDAEGGLFLMGVPSSFHPIHIDDALAAFGLDKILEGLDAQLETQCPKQSPTTGQVSGGRIGAAKALEAKAAVLRAVVTLVKRGKP